MAKQKTELDFSLVDNVSRGLKGIQEGVSGLGASITKVNQAAALTGRVIDALGKGAAVFGGAIDSATEFGAALAEVRAVTGASEEEFRKLKQAAEDAVGTFDATEAANGLAELSRSGFDANEAISALNPTLNLALGQQLEVARAAELTAQTLKQFGLEASEAARVADVLAKAADSTAAGVEDTGLALTYAAPLARQLGLSLEETTAAIGALSNAGFKGEKAGTALRNVFSQLIDPSTAFSRAVKAAGIESNDLAVILDGLSKSSDGGKAAFLALDAAATPAILALAQQGGAAIRGLTDAFNDAGGAAQATADIFGGEFGAKIDTFVNKLDQAQRKLATPIIDAITDDVGDLTERLDRLIKSEQFRKLSEQIAKFVDKAAEEFVRFVGAFDFEAASVKSAAFVKTTAADLQIIVNETKKTIEQIQKFKNELNLLYKIANSLTPSGIVRLSESMTEAATAAVGLGANAAAAQGDVDGLGEAAGEAAIQLDRIASPDRSAGFGIAGQKLREYRERLNELRVEAEEFRAAGDLNAALEVDVKVDEQVAKIAELRAILSGLDEDNRKLKASADAVAPSLNQLQEALTVAFKAGDAPEVARLAREIGKLSGSLGEAAENARLLNVDLGGLEKSIAAAITEGDIKEAERLGIEYRKAAEAQAKLREEVDKYTGASQKSGEVQDKTAKQTKKSLDTVAGAHKEVAKESDNSGQVQEQSAAKAGSAVLQLAARINALRAEFAAFGEVAAGEFEARLNRINFGFRGLGTSMINYVSALENAAGRLRILIGAQEDVLKSFESGIGGAAANLVRFGGNADEVIAKLEGLERSTRDANGQFNLLSQQRLNALRSEIQATTAAIQAQAAALAELNRIAASGDPVAQANLDYQQQLRQIEELAAAAGASAEGSARAARAAAEREHRKRLAEIAERAAAEAAAQTVANQSSSPPPASPGGGGLGGGGEGAGFGGGGGGGGAGFDGGKSGDTFNVSVTVEGAVIAEKDLAQTLAPELERILKRREELRY